MATPKAVPVPVQAQAVVRQPWTTPQLLKGGLYALWLLDAILLVAILGAVEAHRSSLQVIGRDTAPSIIAAQHIKAALADMDANAANELLVKPGQSEQAVTDYESRRQEASGALIRAARNITFKEEEEPIETIQREMGTYEVRIQKARDLHERDDAKGTVEAYLAAAKVLDDKVLPAADRLDRANRTHLDAEYDSHQSVSIASRVGVLFAGLALMVALFMMQATLTKRTRRTFNLGLLAGTLVVFGMMVQTMGSLMESSQQLKVAKEDAFTSVHVLWQARSLAFSANADESRYLLEDGDARALEQSFFVKVGKLGRLPERYTYATIAQALGPSKRIEGFEGYFADAVANTTFEGEREAAMTMLVRFGEYAAVDRKIRALRSAGKRAEAVALCAGTKEGESNWAFERFDVALRQMLDINQKEFDQAVGKGFSVLEHFEAKAIGFTLLIAALIFLGLLPRIQEYR